MNDQMTNPNGQAPKRTALIVILAVLIVVVLALAGLAFSLGLFTHGQDQVSQPTVIVEEDRGEPDNQLYEVMTAEMMAAEQAVQGLVAPYGESVAVSVLPLDGTAGFSINGDEQFVSASMIKLPILATYMKAVYEGTVDPQDSYTLKSSDVVGGAGIVQNSSAGTSFTYDALARDMIMYSDNTATNIIIDTLGMNEINGFIQALGFDQTKLNRKMMHMEDGKENQITANDCAWILREIACGTLISSETCKFAEEYLLAQDDNEGLAEGLPSSVGFGHKTGSLTTVRHDGGIVYAPNPYVIVVLTSLEESTANQLMASISATVYENLE